MSFSINNLNEIQDWHNSGVSTDFIEQSFCSTRGDLNGRLSLYEKALSKSFKTDCLYLFMSSLGEVGNNCFDHNLGFWQDRPGALFIREENYCIIADRGQGIRQSLQKVVDLKDCNAIEFAFTHIVSGRAPEKRGNGLKHVKRSLKTCGISLCIYSGREHFELNNSMKINLILQNAGVFALFYWS